MVFYAYVMEENNLQQIWQNTATRATCSYNYIIAPVLWILSVLYYYGGDALRNSDNWAANIESIFFVNMDPPYPPLDGTWDDLHNWE